MNREVIVKTESEEIIYAEYDGYDVEAEISFNGIEPKLVTRKMYSKTTFPIDGEEELESVDISREEFELMYNKSNLEAAKARLEAAKEALNI